MSKSARPSRDRRTPRDLDIVHEDRDLIVVNKHAGLLTMSFHKDQNATAEQILTRYLRKGDVRSRYRAHLVHRLDRETSGLLMFAKSFVIREKLKENWPVTEKRYLGIVHGHLPRKSGIFSSLLDEDNDQYVHSTSDEKRGKHARTSYVVLKETPRYSVVKINLLTGRKNQIRVHFAEAGHPIVGDPKYGQKDGVRERMALHAKSLAFPHPFNGRPMKFETDIPLFFQKLAGGLDETVWNSAEASHLAERIELPPRAPMKPHKDGAAPSHRHAAGRLETNERSPRSHRRTGRDERGTTSDTKPPRPGRPGSHRRRTR